MTQAIERVLADIGLRCDDRPADPERFFDVVDWLDRISSVISVTGGVRGR